jgi:predicted nuclease of predicted toxin-antitoxin system
MKLLVDMNLSPTWVATLREAGHDATHWAKVGEPTAPDVAIMRFARVEGYVVVTNDLDFSAILAATGGVGPSVIQIRGTDLRPSSIAGVVLAAISQMADELNAGALLTIDPARTRVRVLPLDTGN